MTDAACGNLRRFPTRGEDTRELSPLTLIVECEPSTSKLVGSGQTKQLVWSSIHDEVMCCCSDVGFGGLVTPLRPIWIF
jgi:hypothetical protein